MMRRLLAPFLPCLLVLSSCIIHYTDFPVVDIRSTPVPGKVFVLHYHVDPVGYYLKAPGRATFDPWHLVAYPVEFPLPSQRTYLELERVFQDKTVVPESIAADGPPAKGLFCSVDVLKKEQSWPADFFTGLSYLTGGLIPSYSDTSGDQVLFDLYVDGELRKTYRYEINMTRWLWLGLMPVAWINWMTPSRDEVLRSTVHRFLIDAEQDGLLGAGSTVEASPDHVKEKPAE